MRAHRARLKWTQADLARKSGLTTAGVSKLEKAENAPGIATTYKLARAFNITIDEFIKNDTSYKYSATDAEYRLINSLNATDKKFIISLIDRFCEKKGGENA